MRRAASRDMAGWTVWPAFASASATTSSRTGSSSTKRTVAITLPSVDLLRGIDLGAVALRRDGLRAWAVALLLFGFGQDSLTDLHHVFNKAHGVLLRLCSPLHKGQGGLDCIGGE